MNANMKRMGTIIQFLALMGFQICALNGHALAETQEGAVVPAPAGEVTPQAIDQTKPTVDYPSAVLERASSGFSNIVYGPLEVIYNTKEEIKRTDPLRGLIPGLGKGTGWMVTREAVGVFELVTCFLPYKPVLKKFNTDWIYL